MPLTPLGESRKSITKLQGACRNTFASIQVLKKLHRHLSQSILILIPIILLLFEHENMLLSPSLQCVSMEVIGVHIPAINPISPRMLMPKQLLLDKYALVFLLEVVF